MQNLFLICRNQVQTYNVIINLGHIFSFKKMVTYVQNQLIKAIIIVDISIIGFNAHCMRPTR